VSLGEPMADGRARIEPLREDHREALRAACAEDAEIWTIYPSRFFGTGFDAAFDQCFSVANSIAFALLDGDALVGMSAFLGIDTANKALEIGRTYLAPRVRGSGFNGRIKRLMLDRAFACAFTRVEFRIDTRNGRSMAAVEKLGARRDGVLRANRITWTGHVRDTAVYSILAEEWRR
jgi:RimJ/RimL family protein N-acetyltransferase